MDIKVIQKALIYLGFSVGSAGADGIWGRNSMAGLKAWQTAHGLTVTGVLTQAVADQIAKELTAKSLVVGSLTGTVVPPWLQTMRDLTGLKEVTGVGNNSTILAWAKSLATVKGLGWIGNSYTADSIPWCGLAIAHVVSFTLPEEPLPSNPLGALNWARFGEPLAVPTPGAIMVFSRTCGGHVSLYEGEDASYWYIRGGNQSDAVTLARKAKDVSFVGARWPSTYPMPTTGRVQMSSNGVAVNTKEA